MRNSQSSSRFIPSNPRFLRLTASPVRGCPAFSGGRIYRNDRFVTVARLEIRKVPA